MRIAILENGIVTNVIEADAIVEADATAQSDEGGELNEGFRPGTLEWARDDECVAQIGGRWDGKLFEPAPEVKPSAEQIAAQRTRAYAAEADPLFFKWQRGEADRDDWIAKVEEIKARFPKE